MYAKLVFPDATENTQIARDIARAIVNSTGAGGSTVGALEFVDAGSSTIDDTVAANWTLAGGESIPTGATVVQDLRYHLQQAHENGTTKTVALGVHVFDSGDTSFTKANNTSGYNCVTVTPVLDYGQSYVAYPSHPSESASPSTSVNAYFGVSATLGKATVHVIARDKTIAIIGDRKGYLPSFNYNMVTEPVDTYETREGRNRPGQIMMVGARTRTATYGAIAVSGRSLVEGGTSTQAFSTAYNNPYQSMATDLFYDYENSEEIRLSGWCNKTFINTNADPSNSDPGSQAACYAVFRDPAQATGYNPTWQYDAVGTLIKPESFFFSRQSSSWAYSNHVLSQTPVSHFLDPNVQALGPKDLTGTDVIKMFPVAFNAGNGGNLFDVTTNSGFYVCSDNGGREDRIINDGTDDYLLCPLTSTSGDSGAIAIRTI